MHNIYENVKYHCSVNFYRVYLKFDALGDFCPIHFVIGFVREPKRTRIDRETGGSGGMTLQIQMSFWRAERTCIRTSSRSYTTSVTARYISGSDRFWL